MLLWIRGLIFTALVPAVIAFVLPSWVDPRAQRRGDWWELGWVPIAAGSLIYLLCLVRFLAAGGTPAIFFTRHLRFVLGEEPGKVVSSGLYRLSRNPMYVGVLTAVFGQALLYGSLRIGAYWCVASAFFHCVVEFLEEPHLRATRGASYEEYCRTVRRWL